MNTAASEPPSLDSRGSWLASVPHARWAIALAALAGVVCFANTLGNDFCFDDVPIVRDNPRVNEPGQWLAIVAKDHWADEGAGWKNRDLLYRPVTLASYRVVRMLIGSGAFGQHLVNILLHGAVCALIAFVGVLLAGSARAGLVAGVLFAVLPIHTEAVASVVGRADLMAALGVLGAMLLHVRSRRCDGFASTWRWRLGAGLLCLIAMGAKENGIAAAPMIVLADALWHRRGTKRTEDSWWNWHTVTRLAYVTLPVAVYLIVRWHVLGGRLAQDPPTTKTVNVLTNAAPWQHALGVVQLWGMYWAKTFWPAVLTIKYSINGIRLATSLADGHVVLGAAVAIALGAVSVRAWRRGDRRVAFLAAAILVCYLPTSNALVLMQVFFAERIWYLPSAWACLLLAIWIAPKLTTPVVKVAFAAVTVAFTIRCYARNTEWASNEVLFAAAYRDAPESVGAIQLYGSFLVQSGRFDRAFPLLHKAIEIDPGFTNAYRDLGRTYLAMGDDAKAVRYLQLANMQAPGHPLTVAALQTATARLAHARTDELNRLRAETDRNPDDLHAELAFVTALRSVGRLDEALHRQRDRDAAFADRASWQHEFAVTLVLRDEVDEAIAHYRKSLAIDSDVTQRMVELAMLLLERRGPGDLQEADLLSTRATKLAGNSPGLLACQAEVAAARGDVARAVSLLRRAAALVPPGHPQRGFFLQRAKALGDTDGGL